MEHKALIIGGGAVAALVLVVVAYRMHANSVASSQSSAAQVDTSVPGSYFSGTIPSAVGYTSSQDQTVSTPSNSGSTATGGGFDISSLLQTIAGAQATNAASQIQANTHTADSQVLAGINLGDSGGTASVTHSTNGTSVTVAPTKPVDPIDALLTAEYQTTLGRAPDAAGFAWWQNALHSGLSATQLHQDFLNSDEYKKSHPTA